MLRLLVVALVLCTAFVICAFVGSAMENRARALHAGQERSIPALAVAPHIEPVRCDAPR